MDSVWCLRIQDDGETLAVCASSERAHEELHSYVKRHWGVYHKIAHGPVPREPGRAVDKYFELQKNSSYTIRKESVLR